MTGANTQEKRRGEHLVGYQFKPGNPGRPKGSRNKLGEAFVQALHNDFQEHGIAAIQKVRDERPQDYLKVIAQVIPKEVHHMVEDYDDLSDDELAQRFTAVAAQLADRSREDRRNAGAKGSGEAVPGSLPH